MACARAETPNERSGTELITAVEIFVVRDPGFWFTALPILFGAIVGIFGVIIDAKRRHGWRSAFLIFLICTSACLGIGADAWARIQSGADRQNSAQRERQLHEDNVALRSQNSALQKKADATYGAAMHLNRESARILATIQQNLATTEQNLGTTRTVGNETKAVALRARQLQVAAADSIMGIEKLASPLTSIAADYEVDLPIDEPQFRTLKAKLLSMEANYEQQVKAARPQNGVITVPFPIFPIADVLSGLPPLDPGSVLLRGMDLAIEMYRPPFPKHPYYGDSHHGRFIASSNSVDYLVETIGIRSIPRAPMTTAATPTAYNIQLGFPVNHHPDLTVMVTALFVPMERVRRSGRLDSFVDLPGSELLIHLMPDFLTDPRKPSPLQNVRLDGVALDINGSLHRIDLQKARIGWGPMFPYYEVHVPASWRPSKYFIP